MMRSPAAIFGAYHGHAVAVVAGRCADTHPDAEVASIVRRRAAVVA
ncbi:hypothetical protein ACWGKW_22825 [Streptomyces sp. NPDC054766]